MKLRAIGSRLAIAAVLVLLGLLIAVRATGALVQDSRSGRAFGYHQHSQQWLVNEFPHYSAELDGPYVFHSGNGEISQLNLTQVDGEPQVDITPVQGRRITVPVDGRPEWAFDVPLRQQHPRARVDGALPARMLVASDFEGEFEAFVALLQGNGVIDEQWHWRFGDGELVLVGDMVDRGRNVLPVLWLVYRLEAEAAAAGGAVHYVLGNHEQKLVNGRVSDVHKKYYGTFRLADREQAQLFADHSELGRWLRSKPVLLKRGGYLFVHGGVSPELLALKPDLQEVDRLAAKYLITAGPVSDQRANAMLWESHSLTWYRGLALASERAPKAGEQHVRQTLQHFDVQHIVIGHTLAEHVAEDFGGAVIRVDVRQADGVHEALLVEEGSHWRVDQHGNRQRLDQVVNLD